MAEVMLLTLKLLVVKDVQQAESEVVVSFVDGQQGRLPQSHEQYDYYIRLVGRSQSRRHPVAVSIARPDKIVELARADNDFAARLMDHDAERMKVVFHGHDGTFYLRKDHPEFQRIGRLLQESIDKEIRLWFVARKPSLLLMDVIEVEEEKE